MDRGRRVDRRQRARVGGAIHVRALLCRDARGICVGSRPDRTRILAELAGFRRLRASGRLALRPLGNTDGRGGRRSDPWRGPGAYRPGHVARALLSGLRRARRRGYGRHAHSIDDDRDAMVRAFARHGDGGAERRRTGKRGGLLSFERVAHLGPGLAHGAGGLWVHRRGRDRLAHAPLPGAACPEASPDGGRIFFQSLSGDARRR